MAQKVHIVLEDDLDGSEATETVSFGLDGTNYEIDLNDENATALREALATYVGHARKVSGARRGGGGARRTPSASSSDGPSAKEIREWARENGHEVPERGRIPADVREAYDSAH
ncbi:histone-like nucleoid-structuring protein Lsr2 [Nocardioides flavescens]|uniref:Lsr2 family protein n=1 Tax=Nocardioides flavescens TaxID=2691959 RepID=A0A6L7EVR7_9ACTN|nr:Lsr2 family protein [Nocardioides flavescens]MXG89806.1 Lsr2 family protein [Nocardioides flavescens]